MCTPTIHSLEISSLTARHISLPHSLTGGSIVGDMAPYQAFAIGGLGSVRGYGEGAVGSGRLCLIANCEYTIPLVCQCQIDPAYFMDFLCAYNSLKKPGTYSEGNGNCTRER